MLVALLLACIDPDASLHPGDTAEVIFEVPKGASGKSIGDDLVNAGVIDGETSWKIFLRSRDLSCLKAGKFKLTKDMSLNQVADALCGPPLADDVPFTVLEGWRIRDIDAALVAKGWIDPGAYEKLATEKAVDMPFEVPSTTLEGYLYPETYMVDAEHFDPKKLIERQLGTFQERFLAHHADFGTRDLNSVVVMASMLEREEPDPENRPVVAGILWKRIDHGWKLGVDATSRYELPEWNDRDAFLVHLRDPNDPYNTRLRDGLPPTAIGNPTVVSLEAALAPKESEWWYYLHDGDRKFHGGRDAAEHDANRARYGVY